MTCWLRLCVEMETRCRIPIWRTFWRIQWHDIPEPRITLQCAATWWIHCHNSRATCHIAGCSHLTKSVSWSCKNSIRHIENRFSPYFIFFVFNGGRFGEFNGLEIRNIFDERRLSYRLRYTSFARYDYGTEQTTDGRTSASNAYLVSLKRANNKKYIVIFRPV